MLDHAALHEDLTAVGLSAWNEALDPLLRSRFAPGAHGKLDQWRQALATLPEIAKQDPAVAAGTIVIGDASTAAVGSAQIRASLLRLLPWRKGPFRVHGVEIDSEWRSDLKWDRIRDEMTPLDDRIVLDVGCGNGYYALRMYCAGAGVVIGVDPTLQYVLQFLALRHFLRPHPVHALPLRLEDLPQGSGAFDTVFSMGVLYHRREPAAHLEALHGALRPRGELVLETLILPGADAVSRTPEERYARMRNVWHLPTIVLLEDWLDAAGFDEIRVVNVTVTSTDEQRSTEWMPFESLAEALDPADRSQTIEGWPAPRRAAVICRRRI